MSEEQIMRRIRACATLAAARKVLFLPSRSAGRVRFQVVQFDNNGRLVAAKEFAR